MGQWPEDRLEAYMPMGDLEDSRSFSFTDVRGMQVLNTTGHKVGQVKDVFVDPNTREPAFALLDYQKFMNFNVKSLLVPWRELKFGPDYVQTRVSDGHSDVDLRDEMDSAEMSGTTAVGSGV